MTSPDFEELARKLYYVLHEVLDEVAEHGHLSHAEELSVRAVISEAREALIRPPKPLYTKPNA